MIDSETRNRLKKALRSIPGSRSSANIGEDLDSVLAVLDIENLLNSRKGIKFTDRQRQVISRCLIEGYTESEVAKSLNISQQAVSYSMTAALNKLYILLTDTSTKTIMSFSKEETDIIVKMYSEGKSDKEIAIAVKKPLKSTRNKIRYLREKGVIGIVPKVRSKDSE